ncbi:ATP-binding cassette, subfamily B [Sporobacter termitidis DSM 10068]|uniref:ATP-binding cassette, subfamily B n=1 Tax=Sporobacter termitidis DSM 10068 TaxID=1123282 RepID=A0A1M5UDG5_9FIRM|nr:ABC transporter ATP-binding protein [Sporobacter termitidis]SHH60856.1 ATP-binding cassette, subfamily B [Sporobacter termitidis DSM 10068]
MAEIKKEKKAPKNSAGPKNGRYVAARLFGYLYRFKWLLFLSLVLTVASNFLSLIGPRLAGYAIDAITPGVGKVQFDRVFYYCALMAAFFLFSSLFSYVISVLMIRLSQRVTAEMRGDVFRKLMDLPVGFFDKTPPGDILSRVTYDIDTINTTLSTSVVQILTSLITVVMSFVMMLSINVPLVSIFVVTIPLSIFITRSKLGKLTPRYRLRTRKVGELNSFSEETVTGHSTVKAYGRESVMEERFASRHTETMDAWFDVDYHQCTVNASINFINNLSMALISVVGALLYFFSYLSLGNLAAFVLYSNKFSGPISEAANLLTDLQSAAAAAERVFLLIDEAPEQVDAENARELDHVRGHVKISDVTFGYTPEKEIIHKLSLEVPQGGLIAIVGPTGAGKTTIINLLMRFYDVGSGAICIDGEDIRTVTRKSLRRAYTMVLQDTWLFSGTIFENIAYAREDATMDEVVRAAKAAKIHSFIASLPEGYNTVLSDNAVNISKGQRQLLTIARAMLLDSRMLILDEATSNVDTKTELEIQDAMYSLMKNKTCFVIAHRLSTIQNADHILVIQDGAVVEQGVHAELIARDGAYSRLYHAQFET